MKIKDLIARLSEGDPEATVMMDVTDENGNVGPTENIAVSFDDNGDVCFSEAAQ